MTTPMLDRQIVDFVSEGDDAGRSFGAVVDHFVATGYDEAEVELEVWALLRARRLTLAGFIRLTVRRGQGHKPTRRAYDMLLVPWSPERDPR
jgi:hypothetical protein